MKNNLKPTTPQVPGGTKTSPVLNQLHAIDRDARAQIVRASASRDDIDRERFILSVNGGNKKV